MPVVYNSFPTDFNTKYLMSYVDGYVDSEVMYYSFIYYSNLILFTISVVNKYDVFETIMTRNFYSSEYLVWSRDCKIKELFK